MVWSEIYSLRIFTIEFETESVLSVSVRDRVYW
jgi:hypothetical protein